MKAPLILGLHYSTLATLAQDFPEYYNLITNSEIIAINQDPSSAGILVTQRPSQQQQQSTFNSQLQVQIVLVPVMFFM